MNQAERDTITARLATRTTASLCEMYETLNTDTTETAPIMRGWIMDELERRAPEDFNAWLDADFAEMDYPSRFFN